MKKIYVFLIICLIGVMSSDASAPMIQVCVAVRGNTGLETELKEMIEKEFLVKEMVEITEDREECHVYVDLSLVEQEPIRFYGLGISIAYKITENLYSRPTSDVAQFGREKMGDVCKYLVTEIDKAFLEPLRNPPQESERLKSKVNF
ncbi:MAG: hypothetical protein ABH862_03950 [Candidatus Omnitrophota bacterium]